MLEKILNKLGYVKKRELEEAEIINKALVMFPHTVFKNMAGNNYIPITQNTLQEAADYKLIKKVDLYNQMLLSVEKKE